MPDPEKEKSKEETGEVCDVITARGALLDFYSDKADSFSNQFLASVFGLVASSAIIQSVFVFLSDKEAPSLEFMLIFIIPSAILFVGLSYMVSYTYKQFHNYSDIANNLTVGTGGIREKARLDKLYIEYEPTKFVNEKSQLQKVHERLITLGELPEGTELFHEWKRGNKTAYSVNHIVHMNHQYATREKNWWRKNFKWLKLCCFCCFSSCDILSSFCQFSNAYVGTG